jgi:hypothetical protein
MAIGTPRGQHALTVSAVFTSLATFFTILRIYTRAFIVKQMGADDWTILVSLVCLSLGKQDRYRLLMSHLHRSSPGPSLLFSSKVRVADVPAQRLLDKAETCNCIDFTFLQRLDISWVSISIRSLMTSM